MSAVAWSDLATGAESARSPFRGRTPRRHLALVPTGDDVLEREAVARAARARTVAAGPGGLRVTRLGRLVLTGLTLAITVVIGVFALSGVTVAAPPPAPRIVVTVQAGQTLSGIAAKHLPGDEVSDAVSRIQVANNLDSADIHAGQQLVIPTT